MPFPPFPQDAHDYSEADLRQAFAGLVARTPAGAVIPGFLVSPPAFAAVPSSWKVSVGPFTYVRALSDGVVFTGIASESQLDIGTAAGIPAGQGRIDSIAWNPAAGLSVIAGAVSATPAIPSVGSLVRVGTARVNSGDGMLVNDRVTFTGPITGLGGISLPWAQAVNTVEPDRAQLRGSWLNQVNANWNGLQTCLSAGTAQVTGAIRKTTPYVSQELILTLPPLLRPRVPTMLLAGYSTGGGYLLARTNGDVITSQAGPAGQIAIAGSLVP